MDAEPVEFVACGASANIGEVCDLNQPLTEVESLRVAAALGTTGSGHVMTLTGKDAKNNGVSLFGKHFATLKEGMWLCDCLK